MRRISILLLFAVMVINCGSNTDNTNQPNKNTPTATPTGANNNTDSNSNAANSNVANADTKKDDPVPTFADAATAFAEGNKYYDANETEKAVQAYKQAVKLDPDLAEAHFKLGVTLGLLEKEEKSETELAPTDANQATPTPSKVIKKGKGKNQIIVPQTESAKAFEAAIAAYKKVIAKNPKDDVAYYNLSRSYNKLNDDKEAEKAIRQAVLLKPDNSEYQTALGEILVKFAKYDQALGVLKKALKLDESNSQAQALLDKAQAGKRRTEYGVPKDKPKPPQP